MCERSRTDAPGDGCNLLMDLTYVEDIAQPSLASTFTDMPIPDRSQRKARALTIFNARANMPDAPVEFFTSR